jgi:hypothetical protein
MRKVEIKLKPQIQSIGLKPKFELTGNRKSVTINRENLAKKIYAVEFSDPKGDWFSLLGFEKDYVEMDEFVKANKDNPDMSEAVEKTKSRLSFVAKYRKSQKRVLYSEEEFNNLFEILLSSEDEVVENTEVFIEQIQIEKSFEEFNIKYVYKNIEKIFKGRVYTGGSIEDEIQSEFRRFLNSICL